MDCICSYFWFGLQLNKAQIIFVVKCICKNES